MLSSSVENRYIIQGCAYNHLTVKRNLQVGCFLPSELVVSQAVHLSVLVNPTGLTKHGEYN